MLANTNVFSKWMLRKHTLIRLHKVKKKSMEPTCTRIKQVLNNDFLNKKNKTQKLFSLVIMKLRKGEKNFSCK